MDKAFGEAVDINLFNFKQQLKANIKLFLTSLELAALRLYYTASFLFCILLHIGMQIIFYG